MSNAITHGAYELAGGNIELAEGLANAGNNLVAAAVGGSVGSAAGGGFANGAAIASTIEEYNFNFSKVTRKILNKLDKIHQDAAVAGAIGGAAGAVLGGEVGTAAVAVDGPFVVVSAPAGVAAGGALGYAGGYLLTAGGEIISAVLWDGDDDNNTLATTIAHTPNKEDYLESFPNNSDIKIDNIVSTPIPAHNPEDYIESYPGDIDAEISNVLGTLIPTSNKEDYIFTSSSNSGITEDNWTADQKIRGQMAGRGWSNQDIKDVINKGPTGASTDNRGPNKTPDGAGRNDTATVYGGPGHYVIINDRTKEITAVSDKNDAKWIDDGRIKWK